MGAFHIARLPLSAHRYEVESLAPLSERAIDAQLALEALLTHVGAAKGKQVG